MAATVIVVVKENPSGRRWKYLRASSFLKARRPELRSGIFLCTMYWASLLRIHLKGFRRKGMARFSPVLAPTAIS